ncbi:MAG: hypothetical protein HZR80_00010 [Candidatus Heimdallarchaeota archaeon]
MMQRNKSFSQRRLERKLSRETQKMTNEELRSALWSTRKQSEQKEEVANDLEKTKLRSFLMEDIYSKELKKRELLEWALKTGS